MTQPTAGQTVIVNPGQSVSENLSFVAYSAVIQNSTVFYWYLDDARVYVPPGSTHFIASFGGVNVANITFQSPLNIPQPPTAGAQGQLVAQFLPNENVPSPGYVGYQPMGRNRIVYQFNVTDTLIHYLTLQIPAPNGVMIDYVPASNFNAVQIQIILPQVVQSGKTYAQYYESPSTNVIINNRPQTIHLPDALPAGSIIGYGDGGASNSIPGLIWITV